MDLKRVGNSRIHKDLTDLQHHIDVTPFAEQNIYQTGVHDPIKAGKDHIAYVMKNHPAVVRVARRCIALHIFDR